MNQFLFSTLSVWDLPKSLLLGLYFFNLMSCYRYYSCTWTLKALNVVFECWLQVAEAEEKTAGGLLLTEASKEKPSIGTVSNSYKFVGKGI